VAQQVDRRLGLSDAISTAWHFTTAPGNFIIETQRREADRIAATLDAGSAMPFRSPRWLFPMMGLAAIVGGLGVLRYGLHGSLDLRSPMVEAAAGLFHPEKPIVAKAKTSKNAKASGEDPLAIPAEGPDAPSPELDHAPEDALTEIDVPDTTQGEKANEASRTKQSEVKAASDEAEGGEEGEEGNRESAADGKQDSAQSGNEASEQAKAGSPKDAPRKGAGSDNDSLMNKMRDAMANLMSKLKIPPQAGQTREMASNQKGGQKDGSMRESGSGQKGEKGQGQPQGKGSPSDDPDAEGEKGDQQAQNGQGRNNEKGAESGSPDEAKSGMGKQDGSKEILDAEQVAAMGKISEIFGKRAKDITGEVMIEVNSSKQQNLRTSYLQRDAAHREAGGEVHRDEIPQSVQHYVQQYFQEVRKSENAAAAKKPAN
jgi:hypothetical protein